MYGINAENGLKMLGGNAAIYCKMLDKYVQGNYFEKFITALNGGDMAETASAAHALKGVSANLSLDEVFEHIRPLELAAKENNLSANDPRIPELTDIYNKTVESIKQAIADPSLLKQ